MAELLSPEQVNWLDKYVMDLSWTVDKTRIRGLIATLRQAWLERDRLAKLLHDLTPGGSEFAGNPDRCAKWIGDQESEHIRLLVGSNAKRQEAEAERDQLQARLTQYEGENMSIKQTLGKALDCPWSISQVPMRAMEFASVQLQQRRWRYW